MNNSEYGHATEAMETLVRIRVDLGLTMNAAEKLQNVSFWTLVAKQIGKVERLMSYIHQQYGIEMPSLNVLPVEHRVCPINGQVFYHIEHGYISADEAREKGLI
jgi:hypothetical protein